jgi:hypothetical protein
VGVGATPGGGEKGLRSPEILVGIILSDLGNSLPAPCLGPRAVRLKGGGSCHGKAGDARGERIGRWTRAGGMVRSKRCGHVSRWYKEVKG